MEFNLLADAEARSPALSLSDSGTPQHDAACKGQDNSGQSIIYSLIKTHKHYNQGESCETKVSKSVYTKVIHEFMMYYDLRPNLQYTKVT